MPLTTGRVPRVVHSPVLTMYMRMMRSRPAINTREPSGLTAIAATSVYGKRVMGGETVTGPGFLRGVALNLSNPKPALFYGSVILSIFPVLTAVESVAVYAIALLVEVAFYAAITTLMATGPMRRAYVGAKTWIDRIAGALIGALGVSLIFRP